MDIAKGMLDIKQTATDLFNDVWDILDKEDMTSDDIITLVNKVHTSRYLWGLIGSTENEVRGEWQISKVYSEIKMGQPALLHGKKSLNLALAHGINPFDTAFAYEACTRAYAVLKNLESFREYKKLGLKESEKIDSEENKDYVVSEINGIVF